MGATKIEWATHVWNPTTGCTKSSLGCMNCYAHTFAERWRGIPGHPYEQGFDLKLWPERLELPLRWRRPRRIFVNSMSDLFLEAVPDSFVRAVFGTMAKADWHTFLIITKWVDRMRALARDLAWPDHVWAGVTIESAAYLWRGDVLRQVPAAVRFLSLEPLLGPLDALDLAGIGWVIVGSETGPQRRPCDLGWVRAIRDRCVAAGVPLFLKQLHLDGRRTSMPELDGRVWDQLP